MFVEIVPICMSVQQSVLNHFADKDVGDNTAPVRYATLPQDPNSIVLDTQYNVVSTYMYLNVKSRAYFLIFRIIVLESLVVHFLLSKSRVLFPFLV